MPETVIKVKYKTTQDGEDLFVCVEGKFKNKVYARQEANVDTIVFWCTTCKWQGGYEADCPIKEGITMTVLDASGNELFSETLEKDEWNGGTSAKKKGMFSREWFSFVSDEFAKAHNLASYNEWKAVMLEDKKEYGNQDYDDNWLFWLSRTVKEESIGKVEYLEGPLRIYRQRREHTVSGRKWIEYEIRKQGDDVCLALCGYELH